MTSQTFFFVFIPFLCFILLGTSLLYANSGTTNLEGLYVINSTSDLSKDEFLDFISLASIFFFIFVIISTNHIVYVLFLIAFFLGWLPL